MASSATSRGTPSTSNRIRPGLMRQTQNSGAPLPEPMRTSAGFFDTGTSGNTRIQTRPARFMWRGSARRGAPTLRAGARAGALPDLARGDAIGFHRLQAELAERQRRARTGDAVDTALVRLSELRFLWLHH